MAERQWQERRQRARERWQGQNQNMLDVWQDRTHCSVAIDEDDSENFEESDDNEEDLQA